jgi:mannose-6-phosphate isomerase-like protein (cupin superfamily)
MRTAISLTLAAGLVAGTGLAQQPAPDKLFASAADVAAMMAKAKAERKPDQANYIQKILGLAPYNANLEYRAVVGPASTHDTEAEMFYVIDGAGTLVTGGTLVKPAKTNAENWSGTAIENGKSQHVAKGDFIMVPEKTPHWFSTIEGTLVLMSIHVPRTASAK